MLLRGGVALACVLIATVVAIVVNRRHRVGPPVQDAAAIPAQLDRNDFPSPEAPFLVVAFSSATCDGCRPMVEKARVLESADVAFCEIEFTAHRDLHARYAIDAVPLVLVADASGVVQRSFLGAASATDLWAAVAELRRPGSTPEPELGSRD